MSEEDVLKRSIGAVIYIKDKSIEGGYFLAKLQCINNWEKVVGFVNKTGNYEELPYRFVINDTVRYMGKVVLRGKEMFGFEAKDLGLSVHDRYIDCNGALVKLIDGSTHWTPDGTLTYKSNKLNGIVEMLRLNNLLTTNLFYDEQR